MQGRSIALAVLVSALAIGCSDDDAEGDADDGGVDSGTDPGTDQGLSGRGGTTGSGQSGSGGSAGRNPVAGSGSVDDEDGGASEPTADGGDPAGDGGGNAGSGEGGGGDGGSGGDPVNPPATGCTGLSECCAMLSDQERMGCEVVADNAEDAMCDQLLPLFCPEDGGGEGSCAELSQCCETLERGPLRLACATTVMTGMELQCEQVMTAFCPGSGEPVSGCQTLAACCDGLPDQERQLCDTIVAAGQPGNCNTAEQLFCP